MKITELQIMRAIDGNYWLTDDDITIKTLRNSGKTIYCISINGMTRFAENQREIVDILFKFYN